MSPKKFKAIREKLNLTQGELASLFGFSGRQVISHIETGFRPASFIYQTLMSVLDSLPEKKAMELIELLLEHMAKIKRQSKENADE